MVKKIFSICLCVVLIALISGCGVQAKRYVEVRERVDQEKSGNAGYFAGTPPAEEGPARTTRKIYVLEFSREGSAAKEAASESSTHRVSVRSTPTRKSPAPQPIRLPRFDDTDAGYDVESATSFVDYTVEKNDTLQKISKKFYDGYSKWPRIYEANKEKIKDPNRIKPGITIRIPME